MKLSILIPTIVGREEQYDSLHRSLESQYNGDEIEICTLKDNKEMSIGEKRNKLLGMANGEYLCFIDDDDSVSDKYISLLMEGIDKGVDCCSLTGIITFDSKTPKKFIHYMECDEYYETPLAYHRYPNHLNCIKSSIAKQFKFPEKNHGEDTDWATELKKSGLIKTEHTISETIYFYDYKTNK